MKYLVSLHSVFFIFTGAYTQKGNKSNSRWNNYVADADAIPQTDFQFFKKGNLYYLTSNDDKNFYVDIRVEDTETEARILREGLVLWINSDGKSMKNKGIHYPMGTDNARRPGMRGVNMPAQTESGVPKSPIAQANTIELVGFPENEQRFFPSENTDNIRGSVKYNDQGILYYRLIIPVDKLSLIPAKSGNGKIPFTLGIEVGARVMMMMGPGMRPGGGPPSGASAGIPAGGGGRPGGGGRGGAPAGGGGMPPVNGGTQNPVLWIKNLALATN